MKRYLFLIVVAMAALIAGAPEGTAQEFSDPILVGGDEPSASADQTQTEATSLELFVHPVAGGRNFEDFEGRIETEESLNPIFVDDVAATPGRDPARSQISGGSDMLEHPESRTSLGPSHPTNAIGPEDFVISGSGSGWNFDLKSMYEFSITDNDPKNVRSHRLLLADIREEEAGEFAALFGVDPLEKVLIGGVETAIIGSADAVEPYDDSIYPATVIAAPGPEGDDYPYAFQWCALNVTPIRRYNLPYKPCFDFGGLIPNPVLGKNRYKEVFLYDVAKLYGGFVGISYDPLQLGAYWKFIIEGDIDIPPMPPMFPAGISWSGSLGTELGGSYFVKYISPLALFRQVGNIYRFSGYSSFEMPKIELKFPGGGIKDMWQFILTNWIIPIPTNPIAIEAIDLAGKSSWQSPYTPACASPPCSPDIEYPDNDLAIAYQTTYFDLDRVANGPYGRPAVFGDGNHHRLRDLLGTCPSGGCSGPGDLQALTVDRFPDGVMSMALFYVQELPWATGGDGQDYGNVNPSHVFDPVSASMIGGGAYDAAVATDFRTSETDRHQYFLVPSAYDDEASDADPAVIYMVDPLNDPLIHYFSPKSIDTKGFNIFSYRSLPFLANSFPMSHNSDAEPSCAPGLDTAVRPTAFRLPSVIRLARPSDNFVPYKVRTGDLEQNGDQCDDLIVTWRGKYTRGLTEDLVTFSDSESAPLTEIHPFSQRVTIVLRHHNGTDCELHLPQDYPEGVYDFITPNIPTHIDLGPLDSNQVASAAIGDVDNDGRNDIIVGNFAPEEGTAYAYLYKGGSSVPFAATDRVRYRTSFKQGDGVVVGVGEIAADHTKYGADPSVQINGLPLMLPEIGCPDYSSGTGVRDVGSIFETYVSIAHNAASLWLKLKGPTLSVKVGLPATMSAVQIDPFGPYYPIVDAGGTRAVPPRCNEREICTAGVGTALPFYADDPCCLDPCTFNSEIPDKATWYRKCAAYLYAYGHIGRSCPLKEYVYEWGSSNDMTTCGWASSSPAKIGEEVFADKDRGGGDGGDSDFASNWKADEVVGDDGGAIAHAGALTRAARTRVQLGGTRLEATNVKPLDVVGGGESVPIFDAGLPMRKLIAASILPFAEQAPQLGEFANRILNDEQFAKLDLQMGQQVPGLLIGPPQSFEAMFLQPMAAVLLAATGVGAGEKPVMSLREGEAQTFTAIDQDKTLMFLRKGPACSLAADMPAIELSGVVRAISSAASWIWDLLVPDAGAATCGNGTVDPGEMCDHPFICKKPPTSMCPSLTFMMICGRPGWTNACQCQAPTCGDGCFRTAAGEACDKTAVPLGTALWAIGTPGDGFFEPTIGSPTQNYGCPPHLYCKSDCTCSTHSWCGDTSINPGEECDDTVDPAIWPRHGCPVGQTCSGCNCSGAAPAAIPIFDWDVKLPIGTTMNTDGTVREITAVVMKAPLTCNYNGVQDLDTEQCDTATLPDDAAASQVESLCPANDPANPRAVRDDCDMTDCSCNYRLPMCEEGRPGVQCDEYSDCAGDEICDVNCQCVGAVDANAARSTYNDCFIHADTFSSEAAAKVWGEWNAWAKNLTGRSDDLFVEPRQTVSVNCRVAAGSAPEVSDLSLSLSGTPMPDASDNLRPFMVIQSSGSEFIDSGTLIYDEYTQVDTPLRILPVEAVPSQAAQKIKAVVLPNLEAAPELAGTVEAVVPMATTSVAHGTQNTVLVNNMIEHKVYSLIPGQDYSVEIGGEAQTIKAEAADIPEGAGITIHEFKFIVPPHCGGWTGVEGYKGCPNEEDMELDSEAVKTAIEANMAAFEGVPTSAIYTGLPWERHFNYNFNMIQSVYGRAGEAEPAPAELAFGFLASKPQLAGRGGCSCYVAGGSVSANAFAPFVLVMLVPVAGIAIGAVGRRKRK